MFAKKVIGILGLTLFVLPFFSVANARTISHRTGDSTAVSNLLLQARKDAMQLRNDAEELQSFNWSKMSWESHAMKLDQIRVQAKGEDRSAPARKRTCTGSSLAARSPRSGSARSSSATSRTSTFASRSPGSRGRFSRRASARVPLDFDCNGIVFSISGFICRDIF